MEDATVPPALPTPLEQLDLAWEKENIQNARLIDSAGVASPPPRQWGEQDGAKGKDMVVGVLHSALDLAKAAVRHDELQAPPDKVLPYYEKAIRALDTALKMLPEEAAERTGIKRHRDSYKSRADQLRLAHSRESMAKERRNKQQSRVPFEQLELDPHHQVEAAPEEMARRPYWSMRLIRLTITQGGYMTPRLFVPKGVWAQVGVKFSGFAPKISALGALLYMIIDKILTLPKPTDPESRRSCTRVMQGFKEALYKLQNDLARPFPFIAEVDVRVARAAAEVSPKSNLSKFTNMAKNLGRNVKNSAAVAYERIGASVPGKVMDDELVHYSQLVCEVCNKCQVFDDWYLYLKEAHPGLSQADQRDVEELMFELVEIAHFMQEVICEIILRDVENLLERYLRKMRKSFARMYWDEDYEAHDGI